MTVMVLRSDDDHRLVIFPDLCQKPCGMLMEVLVNGEIKIMRTTELKN